jgi:hypothetical protein
MHGHSFLDDLLSVRNLEGTSEQLDNTENTTLQMMNKDLELTGKLVWKFQKSFKKHNVLRFSQPNILNLTD